MLKRFIADKLKHGFHHILQFSLLMTLMGAWMSYAIHMGSWSFLFHVLYGCSCGTIYCIQIEAFYMQIGRNHFKWKTPSALITTLRALYMQILATDW